MKFSILIPVYNVEKYLPECLESIKRQTYQGYEVVLVDDGSKDSSGKICDDYAKGLDNVIVVHKDNGGLISARRVGIANASGDYCIFLDSDDLLEPNALEELVKVIENCNPDLIIYNAFSYDGANKKPFFEHVIPEGIVADKRIIYDKFLLSYSLNAIWLKAVKRSIIDVDRDYTEFYRCNFGEDLLQSVPLVLKAKKIYYLDRALYDYRAMAGMMHKYNANYYWSYRKVNLDIKERLKEEGIDNFEEKIAYHLLVAAYGGTTQFKYSQSFDTRELDRINDDREFKNAIELIWSGKYKGKFSKKQRLILSLLKNKKYWMIKLLLSIKGAK